jgi:hypothetical protein
MYRFPFKVKGVDALVVVDHYQRPCPMRITGSGFGDAEPPEDEEFEFHLLWPDERPAPELEEQLLDAAESKRILMHYKEQFHIR